MKKKIVLRMFATFITILYCAYLPAATYINQTRLIVSEKMREVTFSVINEGNTPVLIQLWSDRDNVLVRPETIKMPFIILPPVFRLDAKTSRTVRLQLLSDTSGLAKDRESLFWLNVLEVPPKPTNHNGNNILQMAFRTRIKLFYRPKSIDNTILAEVVKNLHTSKNIDGLQLKNQSPLHISLLSIKLENGKEISKLPDGGLIPPFSTLNIPLNTSEQLASISWIDNYGVPQTLVIK